MTDAEIEAAAARIAAAKRGDEGGPSVAELDALRTAIAEEFGRRRGWTYRHHDRVAPDDLSGRWTPPEDGHLVDNAYAFRWPDGSPAAVAGHVYNGDRDDVRRGLRARADALGLVLSFPTDVPSWWFPGETTLVSFFAAWGRMPLLVPLDDIGNWWASPRCALFDRRDVLSRVPWPGEAAAFADIEVMVAEMAGDRSPHAMTLERLHIFREGHPSNLVRSAARAALRDVGKLDLDGGGA